MNVADRAGPVDRQDRQSTGAKWQDPAKEASCPEVLGRFLDPVGREVLAAAGQRLAEGMGKLQEAVRGGLGRRDDADHRPA
jgi:hypothetical protein